MDPILKYNSDADGKSVSNLYTFPQSESMLVTRLRRVEKTVPYLVRGNSVVSTAKVQGLTQDALGSTNTLDLASSSVSKIGSVPPAGVTGQFAAVTTTSSITWYWDGTNSSTPLIIWRADGTSEVMPRGSIAVTGLAAATTYYFLPYWSIYGGCQIGWVIGTAGSPKIAFVLADTTDVTNAQYYLAQQALQAREPLAGTWMTQATTAAGTGGGTAGGGGSGGSCPMSGSSVVPIGDYGDMKINIVPEYQWHSIVTSSKRSIQASASHPLYACYEEEIKDMERAMNSLKEQDMEPYRMTIASLEEGMFVATEDGIETIHWVNKFHRSCTKQVVHLQKNHLYWANGFLSHNKIAPWV